MNKNVMQQVLDKSVWKYAQTTLVYWSLILFLSNKRKFIQDTISSQSESIPDVDILKPEKKIDR
jgi:hypothetical protein